MSCRQPDAASQAHKCFYCDQELGGQVELNLHHSVTVASGGMVSLTEEEPKPVDASKCVHVRAVCRNGHANLFFVDPGR